MEDKIAMLSFVDEREQRNVEAWGEDGEKKQELLYDSRVMVIGSDVLSQMVLINLAGLGVHNICCVDNAEISGADRNNFLYSKQSKGRRVRDIAEALEAINTSLNATYYESDFEESYAEDFKPEVIIDATNNIISKDKCLIYCFEKNLPFISVASSQESAVVSVWNPNGTGAKLEDILGRGILNFAHQNYYSHQQGIYTSGIVAALAAEQFRKLKFGVDDISIDEPLKTMQSILYQPHKGPITNIPFQDLSVLIIGAGAVGNSVALNLALLGVGNIDIMDGDKIVEHNLSRQFFFYGRVGGHKAEVLSERIKGINGSVAGDYWNCFLTEETMKVVEKKRYDALFGCADKYKARYLINRLAVKHRTPYLDGGTSATSGSAITYVPGRNRCMDCRIDLKRKVEHEQPKEESRCINNPNPSIIIPNMIIGSARVAEFVNILSGNPQLLDSIFKYDTFVRKRIYLEHSRIAGNCGMGCL